MELQELKESNVLPMAGILFSLSGNNYNNARILSKLLFLTKGSNEWIPISTKLLEYETGLSKYLIYKARKYFKKIGILETKVNKYNGEIVTHYKLNFDELLKIIFSPRN